MGRDAHVFVLTDKQAKALQLLTLDPGIIDAKFNRTLADLAERGMVACAGALPGPGLEDPREWSLTKAGRLAADLVGTLNGHMKA